jgi:redox-sensitive bicupin YhaK (pirin superfamily)
MSATALSTPAPTAADSALRKLVHRTRGHGHGAIVRLMSPSDLGGHLKPFVFLDLLEGDMRAMSRGMAIHPHSGIATVTVFTDGEVRFDDPEAGQGAIAYGGVEWMRAGGGVWHGKELSAGASPTMQGFQLWIALPSELENGPVDSQYIEADAMSRIGPAHVILGAYAGATSPVRAPAGVNYLLVTLGPGERWTYEPPAGHSVAWLAIAKGSLQAEQRVAKGDMVIFEEGVAPIELVGAEGSGSTFVLGSAVPHPHDLHLGYYSVHTSAEALAEGERRIEELRRKLQTAGDRRTAAGSTPVFR